MVGHALLGLSLFGVAFTAFQVVALRRLLRAPSPPVPARWPAVSVLKPLKGVDPALADNLRSFFRLDYPELEIVLAVAGPDDPAVAVVRAVAAEHPRVPSRLVIDGRSVGLNPKVDNLANAARVASHDVLLISDSNVRVGPGYVRDLAARLEQPGVGLATSVVRGVGGRGLGGALETLQLNTFVAGGLATVQGLAGRPCVMGKSMMLRRADVDALGGWRFLGAHLAEDQVCAEELHRLGRRIALSSRPVDNVVGALTPAAFGGRHLRWARIRRFIAPAGYVGEGLVSPLALALAALAVAPSALTVAAVPAVLAALSLLGLASERALDVRRPAWHYPALELLRGLAVSALWPVPWVSSSVSWRGNRRRIGPRTRFVSGVSVGAGAEACVGAAVDEGTRGLVVQP